MKKIICLLVIGIMAVIMAGCTQDSIDKEQHQQEQMQNESISQVGVPAITNFQEKRILKEIYELRDQANLSTYTYIVAQQTGQVVLLGKSIGYGIPASTQFNNPEQIATGHNNTVTLPQADPNGLYSPASAEGTWVLLVNPANSKEVKPVYVEQRIIVSQFPLK
jgi:hypothetical protein